MPDVSKATQWEEALPAERASLVRFCAYLTGSAEVAEDLAQETLYLTWRLRARHGDGEPRAPWLAAIARNVCLRWKREHGGEAVHRVSEPAEVEMADRCGEGENRLSTSRLVGRSLKARRDVAEFRQGVRRAVECPAPIGRLPPLELPRLVQPPARGKRGRPPRIL